MPISVAILGTGNLASHLLAAFDKSNIECATLIVRDPSKGRDLIQRMGMKASVHAEKDLRTLKADVIMLAVPEGALIEIQQHYRFDPSQLVVHTSGAEPLQSLNHERCGVFYPLQSFTKGVTVDFKKIPILIEANDPETAMVLKELAQAISHTILDVNSEERLTLHLAAVMVNNFTNHFYTLTDDLLSKTPFSLELLFPLIEETIRKMKAIGAKEAQTGPARRGDVKTIERHKDLLNDELMREIYELITNSIRRRYES